jgi:hypothetical protein
MQEENDKKGNDGDDGGNKAQSKDDARQGRGPVTASNDNTFKGRKGRERCQGKEGGEPDPMEVKEAPGSLGVGGERTCHDRVSGQMPNSSGPRLR